MDLTHLSKVTRSVVVCGVLAAPVFAQGNDERTEAEADRLRQQELLVEAARMDFLSVVGNIPVRSDRSRRQDFRREVGSLREQVVGFWAFRFAPLSEDWARRDLDRRSRELARTLERLREFINQDSDPPEYEPAVLLGDTFLERLNQFVLVGVRLPGLIHEVTDGDVLDLKTLARVRMDLANLESWVRQFRASVR
jgi:hypothetical protein